MRAPLSWHSPLWHSGPWRHWLDDQGSLTRRLQSRCPRFAVRRLKQRVERPVRDECTALGLERGRLALVREVLLECGDTPLVFAHSVAPLAGLHGPWTVLRRLGSRPLGAALFANPLIERHPLEYRRLDRRHPLYRAAAVHLARPPRTLWARRSRFVLEEAPLLVTEVFLPEVLCLP